MTILVLYERNNWRYAEGVAVLPCMPSDLVQETYEKDAKQQGFDFVTYLERENNDFDLLFNSLDNESLTLKKEEF